MDKIDLKKRTQKFAIDILNFIDELPNNSKGYILRNQLGRAGTSVGANYRAACRAKSTADFISKIETVEEEADECCYWLEIISAIKIIKNDRPNELLKEAEELTKIFTSTSKTAKLNSKQNKK
jgi:four helix bundle protein